MSLLVLFLSYNLHSMTTIERKSSLEWTSVIRFCAVATLAVSLLSSFVRIISYSLVKFPPPFFLWRDVMLGGAMLFMLCWRTYLLRRWAGIALCALLCITIYLTVSADVQVVHRHFPLSWVWQSLPRTVLNLALCLTTFISLCRGWKQLHAGW